MKPRRPLAVALALIGAPEPCARDRRGSLGLHDRAAVLRSAGSESASSKTRNDPASRASATARQVARPARARPESPADSPVRMRYACRRIQDFGPGCEYIDGILESDQGKGAGPGGSALLRVPSVQGGRCGGPSHHTTCTGRGELARQRHRAPLRLPLRRRTLQPGTPQGHEI